MVHPTTVNLDAPERMSDSKKQTMDDKSNPMFDHHQLTSEAGIKQAIQEVVKLHLGMEVKFAPSPVDVWLERIPLILSAGILVVGLCWRAGMGQ